MTIATTQRTVKEIISSSMRLYQKGLLKVLPLCALYFLILFILQITQQFAATQPDLTPALRQTLLFGLPWINFIAQPLIFAAVIYTLYQFANDQKTNYKSSLIYCLRRAHTLLFGYILFMLSMMIGTLLLIIPGLIAFVLLTFFYIFILFEDCNAFRSLTESARLVWPHLGRTALILLISGLILIIIGVVAVFIILFLDYLINHLLNYFPSHLNPSTVALSFVIVAMTLVPTLLLPLPAAFMIHQYCDLKIRQAERSQSE